MFRFRIAVCTSLFNRLFFHTFVDTFVTATATATKTLEATLAPPTAHEERRLQRAVATCRRALSESFDSGADAQTTVNGVVTSYTLMSYAKDTLENYIPQLRQTTPRNSKTPTPLGSRIADGVLTTLTTERTSSAGVSRRPGVATLSGFRSVSTPLSGSCGTTCSTRTWLSENSDCRSTAQTGCFTSPSSARSRNRTSRTTQRRSASTSENPDS